MNNMLFGIFESYITSSYCEFIHLEQFFYNSENTLLGFFISHKLQDIVDLDLWDFNLHYIVNYMFTGLFIVLGNNLVVISQI